MSGIIIDVDTRSAKSESSLNSLNSSLSDIIKNAEKTSKSLNGLSGNNLSDLARKTKSTSDSAKAFGTEATASFRRVSNEAANTAGIIGSIKTAVASLTATFAAFTAVNGFNKAADQLTNLNNRLQLVAKSSEEVFLMQRKIAQVSRETLGQVGNTANSYVALSDAMKRSNVTQTEQFEILSTLNKAAALSGSSVEGLNGAFLQLTQGLSSGTLRGEELNSVLEQFPYLGKAMRETLNKTTGELRVFAEQGQLTDKVMVDVFKNMAGKTAADFSKTSATVEQASLQVRQSTSLMFGDLNKHFGFADRFSKNLLRVSSSMQTFGDEFILNTIDVKRSVKNYINQFDLFDAVQLTVRAMVNLDISPLDAYSKYQEYKKIKHYMDGFRNLFTTKLDVKAKAPDIKVGKIDADFSKVDAGARTLKETLFELGGAAFEGFKAVKITFENLIGLIPRFQIPVMGLVTSMVSTFKGIAASVEAAMYDAIMPFTRSVENVYEKLTLFMFDDTQLERYWVNLFQSTSIKEFTANLRKLNEERQAIKLDDMGYNFSEIGRSIKETFVPVRNLLVSLGILDNQLLKLRDSKVDRVAKYFSDIGVVVTRVYKDVFATTVEPIAKKVMYNVQAIYTTVADAFHDTFTVSNGEMLGTNLVTGFAQAFGILKRAVKAVFSVDLLEGLFTESMFDKFIGKIGDIFHHLGEFFKGFLVGIVSSFRKTFSGGSVFSFIDDLEDKIDRSFLSLFTHVADSANKILSAINRHKIRYFFTFDFDTSALDKATHYIILMFEKMVKYSWKPLANLEMLIKKFCEKVKDYFFDVYDAVVGHSYWPDMVDGVVDYTSNLFKSDSIIKRFTKGVKQAFMDLYQRVLEFGDRTGGVFGDFTDQLANTNWTDALNKLTSNLTSTLLSTLLLLFGDTRLKVSAAIFIASTLNSALGNALTVFVPALAGTLGDAMGHYFQNVVSGALAIVESTLAALPQAVQSFVGSLGIIGDMFSKLISLVPILHNRLLWGMIAVAAVYAKFANGGMKSITEIIFGKDATKNKARQSGVVDYVKSYFQSIQGLAGHMGPSLFEGMFRNKKLAIVAAAAFSSAMLESVNLFEASSIGLPLLFYAIMGKDGGSRVLAEGTATAVKVIKGMFGSLRSHVEQISGSNTILMQLFDLPANAISKLRASSGGASPFKEAASVLFNDFKSAIINLNQNADAYAQRKMTLRQALLTSANASLSGPMKPGTMLDFQKSFNDFITAATTKTANGVQVPNVLGKVTESVSDGLKKIRSKVQQLNIVDTLTNLATNIYSSIGNATKVGVSLITEGLSVLFAIIKNKYVLITAMTLGLASMSFAASDATTAITGTAGAITKLSLAITGIVGGLALLGGLKKTFELFKKTKLSYHKTHGSDELKQLLEESEANFAYSQAKLKEAEIRRRGVKLDPGKINEKRTKYTKAYVNLKESGASDKTLKAAFDANNAAMSAFGARNYAKQRNRISKLQRAEVDGFVRSQVAIRRARIKELMQENAPAARRAAIEAALQSLSELKTKAVTTVTVAGTSTIGAVGGIGVALKGVKETLTGNKVSVLQTIAGYHRMREAVSKVGLALQHMFSASGFSKFTASITLMASVFTNSFAFAIGAVQVLYELGVKKLLGGTASLLKNFTGIAVSGLSTLITQIMTALVSLRPLLLLGGKYLAIAAAVGALGLMLFGPGNTFFDNLEWAYDKVRAIFGLEAKTGGGRSIELSGLVKPVTIDDRETNFSKDLSRVDTSKMTAAQYKAIKSVAEETGKALQDLQLSEAKQGFITDAQKSERKKIEDDFRNSLARQPQKEGSSSSKDMVDFSRRMLEVDNRVWTVIKRTLGWSAQKGPQEESLFNKIVAYLPRKIAGMFEPLTDAVSKASSAIAGLAVAAYDATIEFGKNQAKRIGEFWQYMWDKLKERPTAFQNFESRESLRIGGMTSQYRQFLPDNVNKVIEDARSEYENAALRVRDLERGHTGADGKTRNEWIKDNNAAIAALAAKKEFYERLSKTYGEFGKEEETISNFSKDMEKFAAEVKGSLGIDLGPKAIDFKGTEIDKAVLLADVKLVEKLNKELERPLSLSHRSNLQRNKENIKARSKQYVDNLNSQDTFEGRIAFQTKQFGANVNPDMIRRLTINNNEGFRQAFQDLAIAIQSKESERDQLPADSNLRAKVELELIDLNKQKQNLLPVTSWIDDINSRLQTLNIPQLTSTQFLAADTANIDLLKTSLTKAGAAAENVRNILSSGDMLNPDSLDKLKTAIADMVKTDANLRRVTDRIVLNEKLSVFNDKSLNDVGKLKRLQELGVNVDNNALRRSGNIPKVLEQLKRSLDAASTQLPADGSVDNVTFARAQQSAIDADRALSRIGETISLDTLLGQFQDLNVALDKNTFASFSTNAKKSLMEIGRQLYNLERDVSDKDGTSIGMAMGHIEASRQEKLKRARDIIAGESLGSAASIESVLSNAGFSSFELIARMTTDQLKEFVKLANDVAAAKFGVKNAKGPRDYISARLNLNKADRKFNRFSEANTTNFEGKTSNINNLFKTNLDNVDFAHIGSKAISSLNVVATTFKNDFEEALITGVSKGGVSLEALLLKTRKFSEIGEYFTFFSDVSKGMYDAMTKGAKSAFDKFKSLYAESPLEFSDFTRLDVATRRGIASQTAGTEAFGRALELPNLSKELTDILNSVGNGVSVDDAMKAFSEEFKRTMGKTFEEVTGSPFDRLTGAIERLTNAIEGKAPKVSSVDSGKTFTGGVTSDTYEIQTQRIREQQTEAFKSALEKATPARRLQLKDKQIGTASSDKLLRLNKQQRDTANSMLNGILAQQEKINTTTVQGLPTDKMYRDLDEMTRLYNAYIDRIGSIRQRFVDAGRNFADGVVGSFNSALSNFLKNKQEENKTRWTTFRDGFLTSITDNVIETLVSGFTDSFIGENSALRRGIANIGGGIATLFKGGEGSSGVTSTETPAASGDGSMLDSIASFFAPVTTVLGMIFGATSSNGVTTVGAISASTTSIVSAINANTFAVTSALSAGTATDGIGLALQVLGTATSIAGASTSSKPPEMGGGSGLDPNKSGIGLKLPRNATGGFIRGPGTGTSDSIPSLLSNGEFVINAAQTSKFRPLLEAINSGNMSYAAGGLVTPSPYVTPTSSNTVTNSSSQQININITGDISRQTKAEIHRLIPVIATGVNAHNREVLMS